MHSLASLMCDEVREDVQCPQANMRCCVERGGGMPPPPSKKKDDSEQLSKSDNEEVISFFSLQKFFFFRTSDCKWENPSSPKKLVYHSYLRKN